MKVIKNNASIDRIDSNLEYVENNVQFICRSVNVFKSNATEELLYKMCEAIIKNKKNGNCKENT